MKTHCAVPRKWGAGQRASVRAVIAVLACTTVAAAPKLAFADEGGVSFWLPGFFGSLAAAPQQPGWSLTSIYYHTSVSAGADVARAREFETGRIPSLPLQMSAQAYKREPISACSCQLTHSPRRSWGASLLWVPLDCMAALIPP